MDKVAEKLARWFGSTPFISFHILWFIGWLGINLLWQFDPDWSLLTLIVSLEAIFLSLFILRAENIQSERFEQEVKNDLKTSEQILHRLAGLKAAKTRRARHK